MDYAFYMTISHLKRHINKITINFWKIASIINDPTYYESSNNTEEEKIIKNVKEHITKSNFLTSHERDYITNFESKHSNLYGLNSNLRPTQDTQIQDYTGSHFIITN